MAVKTTVRVAAEAFLVDVEGGERLEYEVSALGTAAFALVDAGSTPINMLLSSKDSPSAPGTWKRTWPKPADPIAKQSTHNLSISFAGPATKYTYVVTKHTSAGSKKVLDIDYESTNPADTLLKSVVVIVH